MGSFTDKEWKAAVAKSRAEISKTSSGKTALKKLDASVKKTSSKSHKSSSGRYKTVTLDAFGTGKDTTNIETTTYHDTGEQIKKSSGSSRSGGRTTIEKTQLTPQQLSTFKQTVQPTGPQQPTQDIKFQQSYLRREVQRAPDVWKQTEIGQMFQKPRAPTVKEVRGSFILRPGIEVKSNKEKNLFNKLESNINDYYNKISNIPESKRTFSQMVGVVGAGVGSFTMTFAKRLPQKVLDELTALLSPKEMAGSIYILATNPDARADLQNKIAEVGQAAQGGDPRAVAEIATEFAADKGASITVSKAVKAGKIITRKTFAKFSPTVIRDVKILEGTASERGLGSTLKQLEGKKIDLYHATTAEVKKLFKGSQATKKDIDLVIKDMAKNPDIYLDANKNIQSLKKIITSKPKKNIIDVLKNRKDVFLSGSGSLVLQTKKFRKIGDLDVVAKNPSAMANLLAKELNKKSLLGRVFKNRYKIRHAKGSPTYQIWDSLGHKTYNKKYDIADIATWSKLEKDFGKVQLKKIDGVQIFSAEKQLVIKTKLSQKIELGRVEKELKDITLLIGKEIKQPKFDKVQKLFQEKGLLKVVGIKKGMGTSRRFGWAEQYLGNLKLTFGKNKALENKIINRLKKEYGFTDKMINDNINLYSPTDMYFAPNQIYTHYLNKQGGNIIMIKNQKISAYPKTIQDKLKLNFVGELNTKQRASLANDMRLYRTKNPNKVFVGQKALQDTVGEFEVLAPEFTKIYSKNVIISKRVYIPSLDKFIKVQEAVIGKKPVSQLKSLYNSVVNKLKKGYTVKSMKKDVTNWANKNIKNFKEKVKKVTTKKGRQELKTKKQIDKKIKLQEENFLKAEKDKFKKLLDDIDNSKLTKKQKNLLKSNVRKRLSKVTKRKIKPTKFIATSLLRTKAFRKIKEFTRKQLEIKPRSIKPITRPIKSTTRTKKTPRPIKPVSRPKSTPTKPRDTPVRPPVRPKIRPRDTPVRPPVRITPPPIKKDPEKIKLPKLMLDTKLPQGQRLKFNILYKEKGKIKEIKTNLPINRAMLKAGNLIDRTTSRSMQLKISGVTKNKDINKPKSLLKKFTPKKSKDRKVLSLVEKSKFSIDTLGEKKGLSVSRALKKSKKKKSSSKKRK